MTGVPAVRGDVMPAPFAGAGEAHSYLDTAIANMVRLREGAPDCGTFAFTAPHARAGVSYVVNLVGRELSQRTGEAVLIATSAALDGVSSRDLLRIQRATEAPRQNVWRTIDHAGSSGAAEVDMVSVAALPRTFGYMLIDCPALDTAPHVLSLGPHIDGVFMIVAAGETSRTRMVHAKRLLDASSVHLLGVILNKRTYPVPGFLYRFFS